MEIQVFLMLRHQTNNTGSSLASSGAYQFTERVSIKAEPKMSAPELAYYEAGNTVNYDKTLQADGYVWISYLSYAGNRRYIPVQKLSTEVKPEVKGTINVTNKNDQSVPLMLLSRMFQVMLD